jgi:cell division protein FtsL
MKQILGFAAFAAIVMLFAFLAPTYAVVAYDTKKSTQDSLKASHRQLQESISRMSMVNDSLRSRQRIVEIGKVMGLAFDNMPLKLEEAK